MPTGKKRFLGSPIVSNDGSQLDIVDEEEDDLNDFEVASMENTSSGRFGYTSSVMRT